MSSSTTSTPSIDSDSFSNNNSNNNNDSSRQFQSRSQSQSQSHPYSNSQQRRQGSISTLWSSAEVPFFLDSRANASPNSNSNSNSYQITNHSNLTSSARPSISSLSSNAGSTSAAYALERSGGGERERYGLGMGISGSSGRPSISSEFSLNLNSRKSSGASQDQNRRESLEELREGGGDDDHHHREDRRASPPQFSFSSSSSSSSSNYSKSKLKSKERQTDHHHQQHHPYPFSGPESSSFTDLDTPSIPPFKGDFSRSNSSPNLDQSFSSNRTSRYQDRREGTTSSDPTTFTSSNPINHDTNQISTSSSSSSFFQTYPSPIKEKELRGYQKRRPNHLGLQLNPTSSNSSNHHHHNPSSSNQSNDKNDSLSPRRDISAPSMPISVSYGSQLSSVYGLNFASSSKGGHSPIFNPSEPIPPTPSSPLLYSSNDPDEQSSQEYWNESHHQSISNSLKVPALEGGSSANSDGDFARSSTSGSTLISPITPANILPTSPPIMTHTIQPKKKSKKLPRTKEQLYRKANKFFDLNYTVESPNDSIEIDSIGSEQDYLNYKDFDNQTESRNQSEEPEGGEGDDSNEISNGSSGNTSNSYEAPLNQTEEEAYNLQNERLLSNESSERIINRKISHSSFSRNSNNGSGSHVSVFTDEGSSSQGTGIEGNQESSSLTNTPFSRVSHLSRDSCENATSCSDLSPASSTLPELDSNNNSTYHYASSSRTGFLRNDFEHSDFEQGLTPTKENLLEFHPNLVSTNHKHLSSNNNSRSFHGTSTSSLGRTAILNQSQISLSPHKNNFLPLSPTYPSTGNNGRSPPVSPRRPPSSPGRMNGNGNNSSLSSLTSGPPLSPTKKSIRPATASTMMQQTYNSNKTSHHHGSISSQTPSSSSSLQVSSNHPYASMIEAGLPPTLSAENLIKRESSTSSSNGSGGGFTKRLRAVSTSSRLKVLPNWSNIFNKDKESSNRDGESGILNCDSPTQLSVNGSASLYSGSTSNGPNSPVSINRIPPPLNSHNQSNQFEENQSRKEKIKNRPVSEQRSPPSTANGIELSDSNSSTNLNSKPNGFTGPIGRFRSRTLGSADRRPSTTQSTNFQPLPSTSNLFQNQTPSYPPSASKSASVNLKSIRRPSKTDTLNSSINGNGNSNGVSGGRTPSISLSTSERGSGIFGYESSGGGSSKRNSSGNNKESKSQPQSSHSHSNSNSQTKSSLPPKSPSRPKSKGGWASHLSAGLTLHLSSESLDGIPAAKGCQVIMNYMYYDPFGKPESLVPKEQFSRPTTPKKSKSGNGEKGTEKEEEKDCEDTSGILEFSPKPFESETSTSKFLESDEFCFSMNSSLILKHLTIGNDLKGDLISRQATISLSNLGTHSISGLERKGTLAWRFIYSIEDRSILIENEKVSIRGERKLRPISFQCSSTLLDPHRARKSRLITMVKKSVGSQITSKKLNSEKEFDDNSPSSSKGDLSLNNGNHSVSSLSIPPSPGYQNQQYGSRSTTNNFNRKPSDSSLNTSSRRNFQSTGSNGWNPPSNLVPFRMTRPSIATTTSTAYTCSTGVGSHSTRSSTASQNQNQNQERTQYQPLPSPSRSHYPPSTSNNHSGVTTRRRGASLGEASRANPVGLLNGNTKINENHNDHRIEKQRSISGNSNSIGRNGNVLRNRPSMVRRITPERDLPTLPASSSSGHRQIDTSKYSDRPPSSPIRSRAVDPNEDYGVSPKSIPNPLPMTTRSGSRRERDPNRPPTASESIKLEYLSRDSDASSENRNNGRFVSLIDHDEMKNEKVSKGHQMILNSNSFNVVPSRSSSNSQLKESYKNQGRERSKTYEGKSESSSFSSEINDHHHHHHFNPRPFDLNEMNFNLQSNQNQIARPSTAQPLASSTITKDQFFFSQKSSSSNLNHQSSSSSSSSSSPFQNHRNSQPQPQPKSQQKNSLLAPFQMKEKSKNSSSTNDDQNNKELKKKSSFKSFTSKKSIRRGRTATTLAPEDGQKTGALLVELGWI